jgi:hypothetical protein
MGYCGGARQFPAERSAKTHFGTWKIRGICSRSVRPRGHRRRDARARLAIALAERVGAQAQIRLSDLSVFHRGRSRILAVLRGFFDDSRTDPAVGVSSWSVGGYIGDDHHWENYLQCWPMALANHEVPYFHSKEMLKPNGIYSKWHPLHEHLGEIAAFMADLIKVITQSQLRGVMCLVRKPDLERFNAEKGLCLEPYPLAVYGCLIAISKEYFFESMELLFDHVEKVDSKLAKAQTYADTDQYYQDKKLDRMALFPLPKGEEFSSKRIIELQSADFIAGDFRKNHLAINDWFEIEGKPEDHEERLKHFEEWALQRYGNKLPPPRKSLEAAVSGSPHVPFIWDYDRLCEAHRLRGGVWE